MGLFLDIPPRAGRLSKILRKSSWESPGAVKAPVTGAAGERSQRGGWPGVRPQALIFLFFLPICFSFQHVSAAARAKKSHAEAPVFDARQFKEKKSCALRHQPLRQTLCRAAHSESLKTSGAGGSSPRLADSPPGRPESSPVIDRGWLQAQADILYLKGEAAFYDGNSPKALSRFKEAALFDPHSAFLQLRQAEVYIFEGVFSEAVKEYERILRRAPKHQTARRRLASIYADRGMFSEAFRHYERLTALAPENFLFQFSKALVLLRGKKPAKSLASFEEAERLASSTDEKGEAILGIVLACKDLGLKSKVSAALKRLASLRLRDEGLILNAANFYASEVSPRAAVSFLLDYQKREESSSEAAKALLAFYFELDDREGAYSQLLRMKRAGALESSHYFYMLSFFLEKKEYDQAILFLKDILSGSPSEPYYRYLLGAVYEKTSRLGQALREYGRIGSGSAYFTMARPPDGRDMEKMGGGGGISCPPPGQRAFVKRQALESASPADQAHAV